MKAIALMSGGLDSTLAAKMLKDQGIEVEALNFETGFCSCGDKGEKPGCKQGARAMADQIGVKLTKINVAQEYLKEVVAHPKHGYGSQMNPCMDCRAFILKKSKEYMEKTGASFLISGEVLGQRPMSQQRHQMKITESESGAQGLVVRPLTAQTMEPSLPEQNGWVDRNKFLGISGRSRKEQMRLAKDIGVEEYENPAGGCLLTDAGFSRRLRDAFTHYGKDHVTLRDIMMLKIGRHFRLTPLHHLIVGRHQNENYKLGMFRAKDETLFDMAPVPGPKALLRGPVPSNQDPVFGEDVVVKLAAGIVARYSDAPKDQSVQVSVTQSAGTMELSAIPVSDDQFVSFRV